MPGVARERPEVLGTWCWVSHAVGYIEPLTIKIQAGCLSRGSDAWATTFHARPFRSNHGDAALASGGQGTDGTQEQG